MIRRRSSSFSLRACVADRLSRLAVPAVEKLVEILELDFLAASQ